MEFDLAYEGFIFSSVLLIHIVRATPIPQVIL